MSEDEAFLRAIVDSPGDDTPRLVYADWLDDRGDPRGPYLRAEREAVVADDVGGLRALRLTAINVAGLDPLWVARVSRPPVGVCCDHIRFTECGPRLADVDVDRVQRGLGVQFPETYRAFLLNYNAGLLTPFESPPNQPSECDPVFYFYPVGHSFQTAFETAPALDSMGPLREWTVISPLASSEADLTVWFLGVDGVFRGRVYSDDTTRPEWLASGHPPNPDGPTLPELLRDLVARWGRPRRQQYDI
jgi:uncharacterized protein (TIGR02996 family)